MARLTYLERRGAVYYARVDIPLDLVEHYGTTTRKKSLRTRDENAAKKAMWPVIEAWRAEFEDVRSRRDITADDKAHATWQHYYDVLERDEANRRSMPTRADIDLEDEKVWRRIEAGEIESTYVAMINAQTEYNLLMLKRDMDANGRLRRLATLKAELQAGDTRSVLDAVLAFVDDNRLIVDPDSDDYRDLGRRFMRAEIEGLERMLVSTQN
jgi:hypothetical protein